MWTGEAWEPLSGHLDMYKEVRSTWDVTNVFRFVSFNEPL